MPLSSTLHTVARSFYPQYVLSGKVLPDSIDISNLSRKMFVFATFIKIGINQLFLRTF